MLENDIRQSVKYALSEDLGGTEINDQTKAIAYGDITSLDPAVPSALLPIAVTPTFQWVQRSCTWAGGATPSYWVEVKRMALRI